MTGFVSLEVTGKTATIMLDRPARHNVIEPADLPHFARVLDEVAEVPAVRVLVLTGRGTTFSAGFDIAGIANTDWRANPFERIADRIEGLSVPTLCALNGSAYGGAVDLALACDFRIGVHGMRLAVPAARLGVAYYLSGVRRMVERLGPGLARRLLLAGEELSADALAGIGFLDHLVAPEELAKATRSMAARLSAGAPLALATMKRLINGLSRGALDESAAREAVVKVFGSADAAEGQAAFAAKREPKFHGR
jgi:enoyl-CoA hydratase